MTTAPDDVLRFWFGDATDDATRLQQAQKWWRKDPAFDQAIRDRFARDLDRAVAGELDDWKDEPRSALALVVLLDQLSRNMYRDTARAFGQDPLALAATRQAMEEGLDQALSPLERSFLYMPLMHAEDAAAQDQAVAAFADLVEESDEPVRSYLASAHGFAIQHAAIIRRFGRFPHRNAILGRLPTSEESAFLREPGSRF